MGVREKKGPGIWGHKTDLDFDSKEGSTNEELVKEPGILEMLFMYKDLGRLVINDDEC